MTSGPDSESLSRLALAEAPIGIAVVGLDGTFLRVNRALCEMLGYSESELTTRTFPSITHPDDVQAGVALVERLVRGDIARYQLEKRYVRKDGGVVHAMLSGALARDDAGAPLCFISHIEDITDRKRAQERLELVEGRASGIVTAAADAIISVDEDFLITLFNPAAERIFGYSKDEVVGRSINELLPERLRGLHNLHLHQFDAAGLASRHMGERGVEIIGRRKSGEEFHADAAISNIEVGGNRILTVVLRDVSAQVRAQREQHFLDAASTTLAGSLDYEETLAQVAHLAVGEFADTCILDIVEESGEVRRLEVVSRHAELASACQRLKSLPLDRSRPHLSYAALRDKRAFLWSHVEPDELATYAQDEEHLEVLRTIAPHSMPPVPLLAHDTAPGVMVLVSSHASPSYGAEDVAVAEELARRAALSIENARLYQAARRAVQARDDVLGIIAHDLRNPLSLIRLQAQTLDLYADESDDELRRCTARIERSIKRMERLIEDMLDVTRMEAGPLQVTPARVTAGELVRESVDSQRALAERSGITLAVDIAPGPGELWADRNRIAQVFENLIGNAIKFTHHGGRITVGAIARDTEVELFVSDTGMGMSSLAAEHVFDRFWQGRRADRRGAGLGLAIARGIITAHGGRIWVESAVGKGTTVRFTLPADKPAPEAGASDNVVRSEPGSRPAPRHGA